MRSHIFTYVYSMEVYLGILYFIIELWLKPIEKVFSQSFSFQEIYIWGIIETFSVWSTLQIMNKHKNF